MALIKLVKTFICHGDNKYEIYSTAEHANVERIIHYKLRSCKNTQGVDGKSESQWVVFDPDMPIPHDKCYQNANNIHLYFEGM